MLGYLHGSLGPPSATQLEVAAAALARSPWVAQAVAAVAVLGAVWPELLTLSLPTFCLQ